MQKQDWDDEKVVESIKTSESLAQVLSKLGIKNHGGNYKKLNVFIKNHNIDTSHLLGQAWLASKSLLLNPKCKRDINDYLNNKFYIASYPLKRRLISEGILQHKCYQCNLRTWNNKPIPTQLHHIDGNPGNNQLSNLTILCPNCHAQTDNFCGKNIINKRKPIIKDVDKRTIRPDRFNQRRITWPTKDVLEKLVWEKPLTKIGLDYGVSDNAVRNWCRKYDITLPKMGYWTKIYRNQHKQVSDAEVESARI